MAAPFVGATPAGKHRDQESSRILRKQEEPQQGGSFIFVHLRMSAYGPEQRLQRRNRMSAPDAVDGCAGEPARGRRWKSVTVKE